VTPSCGTHCPTSDDEKHYDVPEQQTSSLFPFPPNSQSIVATMISARRCISLWTIGAVCGFIVTWTNQRWAGRKGTWKVLRTSSSSSSSFSSSQRRRQRPWPSPLCIPRNFHLSPASNVDMESWKTNMTISFTVPPDCQQWVPWISYGRVDDDDKHIPNTTQTLHTPPGSNTTVPTSESIQFSFSSYRRRRYQSSQIYHAILPDIQAGSLSYWYQVTLLPATNHRPHHKDDHLQLRQRRVSAASSSSVQQSDMFQFRSPPLPWEPVRLALIADWGRSEEAVKIMQGMLLLSSATATPPNNNINNHHPHYHHHRTASTTTTMGRPPDPAPPLSAIVVAGDISYANANLPLWEDFLNMMEPLFSTIPLLVAPGNHEIECNRDDFQVFQAYEHYFRVPNRRRSPPVHRLPIPPQRMDCTHPAEFQTVYEYGNSFYSYRHGMVQIIVLNSYTNTTKGSVQYNWLRTELETKVNRIETPWLLVVFHCPLHTTFRGHNGMYVLVSLGSCIVA
jgi:Calcineurin-like phosphoesterase